MAMHYYVTKMKSVNKSLSLRLPESDDKLMRKVCDDQGVGISSFVRKAIRRELASLSYYDEGTKKSLGITPINAVEGVK